MASKAREVREAQKVYWEKKLSQRLGVLSAQGVSPEESEKDPVIRGIKSKISDTKARIRAIAAAETKLVDMARLKEEKTLAELVRQIATHINIPFTVGGGINTVEDVSILLDNGADKISVNTSAVKRPDLINELALQFGSQCVVVAIDAKLTDKEWMVVTHGGRTPTNLKATDWALEVAARGAGEILLTSMENDGTKNGFALDITQQISDAVAIPVIASGGAGSMEHFAAVFNKAHADAALAASIFHFREIPIPDLKRYLQEQRIPVRL